MHSLPFSDSIAHEALFQSKWKVALYGNDLLNVFLVVIVKYIFHGGLYLILIAALHTVLP